MPTSLFKNFARKRESPFDSTISMQNYDDVEVIKQDPTENKRKRRKSTLDKTRMLRRISQVTQQIRDENVTSPQLFRREKKEETDQVEEEQEKIIIEDIILPSDIKETNLEWVKLFPKKPERFTFYWWGDQVESPEIFPPSLTLKIKQVELGGRHYVALTRMKQHKTFVKNFLWGPLTFFTTCFFLSFNFQSFIFLHFKFKFCVRGK